MKNKFYFLILFLLSINFIYPEQLKLIGNYVLLSVSTENGRFLYYKKQNIKSEWIPITADNSPPTSYFRFFYKSGKNLGFGDSGNYITDTKIVDDKIIYSWQNKEVSIQTDYRLISVNNEKSASVLMIDLKITNLINKDIDIDYYFCIDTYLGEKQKKHFILPKNINIDSESELKSKFISDYILSFNEKNKLGISILFGKEKQVQPYRIFFANWKRVFDNIGLFKVNEGRSFDLKPNYLNDSAAFIEYRDQKLAKKNELNYRFIISSNNNDITSLEKFKEEQKNIEINVKEKGSDIIPLDKNKQVIDNQNLSNLLKILEQVDSNLKKDDLKDEDIKSGSDFLEDINKKKN